MNVESLAEQTELRNEIRIRMVYLIKSLIIKGLNESDCSTESA